MTHWFTADPHFGHDNIIRFCGRPFVDAETMDARILAEYRARVAPEDDLWILGDFAASKAGNKQRERIAGIFDAILGRKHLILGNHDRAWIRALPWDSQAQIADIAVDGRRLVLCHYPMVTFPGARRGALQLFGHVHDNWPGTRNSVNVGVDLWGFRPVSLPEIEARAARLPVNRHWDEVEPGRVFPGTFCALCRAVLDPQLVSGHAVLREGRLVVADTGETIAVIGPGLDLAAGDHLCPACIDGHLCLQNLTVPEGCRYVEALNRSIPDAGRYARHSTIRAVAFDGFGTLLRITEPANPWRSLLAEARRRPGARSLDPRREAFPTIEAFAAACGIGFRPEWRRDLDRELASIEPMPDTYTVLERLRAAGFRIALAGNLAPPYIDPALRLLGGHIDIACLSCVPGVRAVKPERRFFEALQNRLGLPAEEILMVGDNLVSDIRGAEAAGMPSLHLVPGETPSRPGQIARLTDVPAFLGIV